MRILTVALVMLFAVAASTTGGVVHARQSVAPPPPVEAPPLIFQVGLSRYLADGRIGGMAGNSGADAFKSYVAAPPSLCGLSSSSVEPPVLEGFGWLVEGTVLARTPAQMTVRVVWKRIWQAGARLADGPGGTQTVTLRNGERVELDRVTPVGASSCGAVDARLEAAVLPPMAYRVGTQTLSGRAAGGRVATGAGGVAAVGAGTNAAAAGGRVEGRAGGRGGVATGAASGSIAGGRGGATGGTGAGAAGGISSELRDQVDRIMNGERPPRIGIVAAARYDVELWLVHQRPDGTETVQSQQVRVAGVVVDYRFPPVVVATSGGNVTLDISGRLQAVVGAPPESTQDPFGARNLFVLLRRDGSGQEQDAAQRIMLSINRRARATGSPLIDVTGGSTMLIDAPSPTDVLSFEFPPLQKSAEDLLKGHTFSLRVRAMAAK